MIWFLKTWKRSVKVQKMWYFYEYIVFKMMRFLFDLNCIWIFIFLMHLYHTAIKKNAYKYDMNILILIFQSELILWMNF